MANTLGDALSCAAAAAIPLNLPRLKPKPPWWTCELTQARSILRVASRARTCGGADGWVNFRRARNSFTACLRRAKSASWRSFCSSAGDQPWGRLYRLCKSGPSTSTPVGSLVRQDGSFTQGIAETVELLASVLVPHTAAPPLVPLTAHVPPPEPLSEEEVKFAIWRVSPNKAPGPDRISGCLLRKAWPCLHEAFTRLFNTCSQQLSFPSAWKHAEVVAIKKAPDKDPSVPKSFRPISLLPTLGKAMEHIILRRIRDDTSANLSGLQYGFSPGLSSYDAIRDLLAWPVNRNEKYVAAVFMDISGAFDNIIWPMLMLDLTDVGASPWVLAMVHSYISRRTASITLGGHRSSFNLTKGCPQGSILGPSLWNVTTENLLRRPIPPFSRVQAYADDLAVLVAADTRAQLISRAGEVLSVPLLWGEERGLSFSVDKTCAVVIKGSLAPGFTLPFGQGRIPTVSSARYLELHIGANSTFDAHVEAVRARDHDLFSRVRGVFGHGWGFGWGQVSTIYDAVFIPRVVYAARFWRDALSSKRVCRWLCSLQRSALLGVSSAYRTSSSDSLTAITGKFPLDIEVLYQAEVQLASSLPPDEKLERVGLARVRAVASWQERWDRSSKGRWTFGFIPDLGRRLATPIWLNHHLSQFLTGHGDFNGRLYSLGLTASPRCSCGWAEETAEHVLFHCPRVIHYRERLELAVHRAGHLWPCPCAVLLSSRALYSAFDKFCSAALTDRSDRP